MKCNVALLIILIGSPLVAGNVTYHSFVTNTIANFGMNTASEPTFTNSVATYAAETTGAERASSEIVMAIALYDIFEQTTDGELLSLCAANCTNVLFATDVPTISWQKSAASAVLSTILATQQKYGESFSVCTNAIAQHLSSPASNDEADLWNAICEHHLVAGLSVTNALRLYAAMSLAFDNHTSLVPAYTNSLPPNAFSKIQEAME